jgi:uncharacterized protein YodC (DUF2158 family)
MAEALKTGDVVRLKSGGPHMTVSWVSTDGTDGVRCHWFVDIMSKEASTHLFRAAELEKM